MSKFNVGDMVTVKRNLIEGEWYGRNVVTGNMLKLCGKTVKVKEVNSRGEYYLERMSDYAFTDEMLEDTVVRQFKIGDKIKAIDNRYGVTSKNNHCEGTVVAIDSVSEDEIKIKVTKHDNSDWVDMTFWVNSKHFDLIKEEDKNVNRFKVGDKVIAMSNDYGITCKADNCEGEVIDLNENRIRIKITKHDRSYNIGDTYWVCPSHFKLIEVPLYKAGDKVIVRDDLKEWESYGRQTFTKGMIEYLGKEITIKKVRETGDYEVEGMLYIFTDEMIKGKVEVTSKFEVGDLVFLREDLKAWECYNDLTFLPSMNNIKGKLAKITKVTRKQYYDVDISGFTFSEGMLEKAVLIKDKEYEKGEIVTLMELKAESRVDSCFVTKEMSDAKGKKVHIKLKHPVPNRWYGYIENNSSYKFYFTREMFVESYIPESKVENETILGTSGTITYNIHKDETIVTTRHGLGKARRNPDDNKDTKVGILIATARALGFKEETVQDIVDSIFHGTQTIEEQILEMEKDSFIKLIETRIS